MKLVQHQLQRMTLGFIPSMTQAPAMTHLLAVITQVHLVIN
jgi:hypothetical protein